MRHALASLVETGVQDGFVGGGWCTGGRAKIRCEGSSGGASWIAPGVMAVCSSSCSSSFNPQRIRRRTRRVSVLEICRVDLFIDTSIDLWYSEFARGTACHVTDDLGLVW